MLESIFDMFKAIFDVIVSVVDVVVESIVSFLDLLSKIPDYVDQMISVFCALPSYVGVAFATAVSVTLVWMIVERGSSD